MVPRWPGFESDLTDTVLERVERSVESQPPIARAVFVAGLWGLEFSGPLLGHGLRRLSAVDRDERDRRLTDLAHHRVALLRQSILLYQTVVNLCAYSLPEVEAHLGTPRRAWRADRLRLREALLRLDAGAAPPRAPAALADGQRLPPAQFLDFGAAARLVAAPPGAAQGGPGPERPPGGAHPTPPQDRGLPPRRAGEG